MTDDTPDSTRRYFREHHDEFEHILKHGNRHELRAYAEDLIIRGLSESEVIHVINESNVDRRLSKYGRYCCASWKRLMSSKMSGHHLNVVMVVSCTFPTCNPYIGSVDECTNDIVLFVKCPWCGNVDYI